MIPISSWRQTRRRLASAALFALNMLVGTRAGASYSEAEYAAWMKQAGFAESKRVRMPGPANLMIATK